MGVDTSVRSRANQLSTDSAKHPEPTFEQVSHLKTGPFLLPFPVSTSSSSSISPSSSGNAGSEAGAKPRVALGALPVDAGIGLEEMEDGESVDRKSNSVGGSELETTENDKSVT